MNIHWNRLFRKVAGAFYTLGVVTLVTGMLLSIVNHPAAAAPAIDPNPGAVWTTLAVCSEPAPVNDNHYLVGQTIYLRGSNLPKNITFTWDISSPNGNTTLTPESGKTNTGDTDGDGNFCFPGYTFKPGDPGGEYKFTVSLPDETKLKSDNFGLKDSEPPQVTNTLALEITETTCDGWTAVATTNNPFETLTINTGERVSSTTTSVTYKGDWSGGKSITVKAYAKWDNGGTPTEDMQQATAKQPDNCEKPEHKLNVDVTTDCTGWSLIVDAPGATITTDQPGDATKGIWTSDNDLTVTVTATWGEGEDAVTVDKTVTVGFPNKCANELTIIQNATCDSWSVSGSVNNGGSVSYDPENHSGAWSASDPLDATETIEVTGTWTDGWPLSTSQEVTVTRNGCENPPPQHSLTVTQNNTCTGWDLNVVADGATITTDKDNKTGGKWDTADPFTVNVTATWPDNTVKNEAVQIQMNGSCANQLTVTPTSDCNSWSVAGTANRPGNVSYPAGSSGAWSDGDEIGASKDVVVEATWEDGWPLSASKTAQVVKTDVNCQVAPVINTYSVDRETSSCDGWSVAITPSNGGVVNYAPGSSGNWSTGNSVQVTANIHWNSGTPQDASYKKTFTKPGGCNAPTTNTLTVNPNETCDGWSVSYDASSGAKVTANPGTSGNWSGGSAVEVSIDAAWNSGSPSTIHWGQTLNKPDCTVNNPPEQPAIIPVTGETPAENAAPILIPVTGADMSMPASQPVPVPGLLVNLGLVMLGIGFFSHGLSKRLPG